MICSLLRIKNKSTERITTERKFLIGKAARQKPKKRALITLLVFTALHYVFCPELLLFLSKFWGHKLSRAT